MANLNVLDGAGSSKYIKSTGDGSNGDAHVPEHLESNSAAILSSLQTIDNMISGSEAQVDVVTSALPTGAATAANQTTIIGHVDGIETSLTTIAGAVAGTEVQVDVLTVAAGENHIGQIGTDDTVIDLTASLDTSAYTAADVLFDTQSIASVGRVNAGIVVLQSLFVLDEDDQGAAMDIYFLDANTSLGTENSAPSISDANARNILGHVSIASADYKDLGGVKVLTKTGIGLVMKLGAGVTTLYVAGVTGGTPTHTASGLRFKFGFLRA